MAIEQVVKVPPAVALLNEIDARRKSVAVVASGLAPVLEMLRAYIVETDARLAKLEERCDRCNGPRDPNCRCGQWR